MRLTVFNGSPHGNSRNTGILIEHFLAGFQSGEGNTAEVFCLNTPQKMEESVRRFEQSDTILIIFPLYVYAMPSIVKRFLEQLKPGSGKGKKLGFIVQFGFPEANQARYMIPYLPRIAEILGCEYLGVTVRGNYEPAYLYRQFGKTNHKIFRLSQRLGQDFALAGRITPKMVRYFSRPKRFGLVTRIIIRLVALTGLVNFYWNWMLKKNNAYDRRFDKPYGE